MRHLKSARTAAETTIAGVDAPPARRRKYPRGLSVFDCHLYDLRRGRKSFDQFAASTRADWSRLAKWVLARWSVPSAVEVTDVEQEMLLAAWRAVQEWDSTRGPTLHAFVIWNSVTSAKKWLHRQRNAKRRDDHAPSRHDICVGQTGKLAPGESTGDRSPVGGYEVVSQETLVGNIEVCRRVFRCDSSELSDVIEKLVSKKERTPRISKAIKVASRAIAE